MLDNLLLPSYVIIIACLVVSMVVLATKNQGDNFHIVRAHQILSVASDELLEVPNSKHAFCQLLRFPISIVAKRCESYLARRSSESETLMAVGSKKRIQLYISSINSLFDHLYFLYAHCLTFYFKIWGSAKYYPPPPSSMAPQPIYVLPAAHLAHRPCRACP